ncbi:MAG: hypothetical protein NTY86_02220 [Deltaproteobacteria bacterium]|nr:hypothetical protein [Deltaproteobacteria bacterium]
MDGQSRIKFNPVTKEIEIEGSEKFVKTYFDKIQSLLSGTQKAIMKAPIKEKPIKGKAPERKPVKKRPVKKVRQSKKASKVIKEENLVRKTKRGDMSKAVLALIQDSPEGIAMTELKEKTGLKDRQIWPIISVAKKRGKIKQAKRGVYIGA